MMKEKWPSCFSIEEPRMNKQILLKENVVSLHVRAGKLGDATILL